MTRAYALLASLLLIATPLAGCTSSPEIEEIVDDILGCMDENAENYDDNATAELLGDCIYLAVMEVFMTAMTEQMEIDEMLEIIPRAGFSRTITSSEFNADMGMQMDTVIEEMVMADLDTDSAYVKMGMSMVPFMTFEYTQVQVGELVNVHYTVGGMMAAENAGMGSYQTRDADPNVMEDYDLTNSESLVSSLGELGGDLPSCDVSELSSDIPADAEPVITFNDESGVQTMTLEYTNDTGHDISIVTLIDDNEDLMSFEMSTDNGSASSSCSYTVMWGDAVVIEVDDTLPRTSIPIDFHVEGMPEDDGGDDMFYCDNGNEISRDLVDDGWDDCGDGSDESDDDGEGGDIPTPEEAMEDVDTDGDGYMSHQEFQDAWESDPENPELDSEEVATLFDDCDYDGNDLIDIDEMQCFIDGIGAMLGGFGDDGGDEDPEQMMDYMDTDDDGYLSLQELIDYINNENEQDGEPPMSSEDEEGTANWFYSGDIDGDDLLNLDEFTQLLESSGDDDGGDDGNDVYWQSYEGGHCEWEGDADGEENAWYCKYSEDDEDWDTWWYYCEDHEDDGWHCTDDFGQSEDYEWTSGGDEWPGSDDDGSDDGTPTPEEAMEAADANEDGYVSFQEFEDFWESDPSNPELDSDSIATLWDDCDYDGNDMIDINEVQCVIDGIGAMFDPGEANPEQIFDWMDADDDGQLTASEWADFDNQTDGEEMSEEDFDGLSDIIDMFDDDDSGGLDLYEFEIFWAFCCADDDDGDDDDGEGGDDEPSRVTMMVMGQTLNAPISDFEVRFLVDCGEPDEEGNEPPISNCTIAASNGLTEGSATVDPAIAEYEFTYEYLDYDGDGLISDMDTLVIDNLMPGVQVELYDTWADQYTSESFATAEVLPGFGALMAVVVLLGAALATRRD
jgi:Ca2+-binding EF-hand superfamily protein